MEKSLIDLHSKEERVLSKEIFDLYMNSDSRSEYCGKLREKSKECGKTYTYLKELRLVYAEKYATKEEEEAYYAKRKTMKTEVPSFVKFCDDLFSVSKTKRFEYLKLKGITLLSVRENFDKYKNHGGKYEDIVDEFYNDYSIFVAKSNYRKERIRLKKKHQRNCEFFDELVEKGFYSISDYVEYVDSIDPGHKQNNSTLFNLWKREIMNYDADKWEEYRYKMKVNKINTLVLMKERIAEFIGMLVTKYKDGAQVDIIDYYLTVGIPYKKFKEISSDYLCDEAKVLFNKFISPYNEVDEKCYDYNSLYKINYSNSVGSITEEEKHCIIEFLRKNNIPAVYYPVALNKYLSGNLNIGVKTLKKEF